MPHAADGRYSPSPTGTLHVGNLRTALAAWLHARAGGGRMLLRIDDLDPQRSREEHVAGQRADLAALGLEFDAEVRTSEQRERHAASAAHLLDAGHAYPCFCTRADQRAAREAAGMAPGDGYPGTCAAVDPAAAAERVAADEPHALRLRAAGRRMRFADGLLGTVDAAVDDVTIRRADGVVAYNLACAVDDATQGIGTVLRGADLASTTPAQLLVQELLGLAADAPAYHHLPLVLGPDGARLGKRHGSTTLADLAADGVAVPRVLGMLAASLGAASAGEQVPDAARLVERWDPDAVPRVPVAFDQRALRMEPVGT